VTTTHPSTVREAVIIQRNSADESASAAHTTTLPMLLSEGRANELTVSPGPSLGRSGGVGSRANGGWRCVGQTRSRRYRGTGRSR
jgi:hypothetical protein